MARVFVAETSGYFHADLTPEAIFEQWDLIRAEDGYSTPASATDEISLLRAFL